MRLPRGTIVLVDLDPTLGHEQRGVRPCVIVSAPEINEAQRYPLVGVVPITGTPGKGILYPPLAPGRSGLRKPPFALVDQVRSVDKRRIQRVYGRIGPAEIKAIDDGLSAFFGIR